MREQVARIRQLMLEAAPIEVFAETERAARREFEYYDLNVEHVPRIDPSPKSRRIRRVLRIANTYGWQSVLASHLDAHDVESLDHLDEAALLALEERMSQLEDCVQHGMGAPDAPPAT